MTTPDPADCVPTQIERPPEQRLHDGLAKRTVLAEQHTPSALRDLAQLRRSHGRFGFSGQADAKLLELLGPLEGVHVSSSEDGLPSLLDDAALVAWLVATARPTVRKGWGDRPTFGSDFRPVRAARESSVADDLMNRLLASGREELGRPLRRAVPLLAGTRDRSGRPGRVDVAALMRDLGDWSREDRAVQRRWAYDFWFVPAKQAAPDAAAPDSLTAADADLLPTTDHRQ